MLDGVTFGGVGGLLEGAAAALGAAVLAGLTIAVAVVLTKRGWILVKGFLK